MGGGREAAVSLPDHRDIPGLAALQRGLAAQQAGRKDEAVLCYRRAIRQNPGLAPAHFNLGQLLRERGEYVDAAICFEGAARLRPNASDAWLNLGAMFERTERHRDAVAAYQRAVACAPEEPAPQYNLGNALMALGDYPGAAAAYRTVIEQRPDHIDAQWNLAAALLSSGDFDGGWTQYEWRWAKLGLDPAAGFSCPTWQGERVVEKRILVWREQGLGDEILFAGCVRELVAAGASVTLAVTPRLNGLFARAFPGVTVIDDGKWKGKEFDFHCPIGGLPRYLRRNRDQFPLESRFFHPDSAQATKWAGRLDQLGAGLKVGICWRSGLLTEDRRHAYSAIDEWEPLLRLEGVHWVNLQYDDCAAEVARVKEQFGVTIHRWPKENLKNDLESVVGLIWNLDAVVTAPTAVSSLAGAAGAPTWEVDNGSDWTAHGEERCPWFPNIRMVRRASGSGDWRQALERVAAELDSVRVPEYAR